MSTAPAATGRDRPMPEPHLDEDGGAAKDAPTWPKEDDGSREDRHPTGEILVN